MIIPNLVYSQLNHIMRKFKVIFLVTIITSIGFGLSPVLAQDVDPDGNPCPPGPNGLTCGTYPNGDCIDCDPAGVPLDGGLFLIIAGALGIGIKRIRSNKD
jgi:hypothetical protein